MHNGNIITWLKKGKQMDMNDITAEKIHEHFSGFGIKYAKFSIQNKISGLEVFYEYGYLAPDEFQLGHAGNVLTNYKLEEQDDE